MVVWFPLIYSKHIKKNFKVNGKLPSRHSIPLRQPHFLQQNGTRNSAVAVVCRVYRSDLKDIKMGLYNAYGN